MRHPRSCLLFLLTLALPPLVGDGAGWAADAESADVTQARERFKAGEKAFNAGRFERALQEFEAGYALVPRPGFVLNMGHCERRLGHLLKARALYKKYLLADPESKQRDEVMGFIAQLNSALADEDRASAAGHSDDDAPADSARDDAPAVTALAPPATAPAPVLAAPAPATARLPVAFGPRDADQSVPRPLTARWWFWAAVGAAVAGAAVGVIVATRGSPPYHADGSLGRLDQP